MTPPEIEDIDAITDLVKGGKDIKQIMAVLQALDAINENDKRKKLIEEQGNANRMFLDKEFVLGKDNVYIYRDNRTKKKGYYIRIYDPKSQTHWTKSLKTTNRLQAMTMAEQIYSEKIGRINIGVRHQSITTKELVALYQNKRRRYLTNTPHQGITPRSFDALCNHIKHWEDFMQEKGHTNTKLEDIPTELGIEFGLFIQSKKKDNGFTRTNYTINHTIAAVKKMYKDVAVKEKYITTNEVPIFEYLKTNREEKPSRDVISAEEFTAITKWINYKYCNEKGIDDKEKIKRRVYGLVYTMSHYMGCRPKEMLGLKWKDISINPSDDKKGKEINRLVHIPATNSKTGKSRDIIAPIAPQIARLIKWYREFGINVELNSDKYVFPRLTNSVLNQNVPTTDVAWKKRLYKVMEGADKDGVIQLNGRKITNYSARHFYITEAIRRGVDIYDIALNAGTSLTYIERTYSHITVQMRSKELTKGLGKHRLYDPLNAEDFG